jgi:hypothetical protein
LVVEGAKRQDCQRAREPSTQSPIKRPAPPAKPPGRCLDNGSDDAEGREGRAECGVTAHLRARGKEATALKQDAGCTARRGDGTHVEGRNRCRRVRSRGDKKGHNSLGCLHVACAYITDRQSGLWG